MYCLNSSALVDHDGLFIFIDLGYLGSYHDVTILKELAIDKNWRQLFTNEEQYFEYVLGDQGYAGLEKYIM